MKRQSEGMNLMSLNVPLCPGYARHAGKVAFNSHSEHCIYSYLLVGNMEGQSVEYESARAYTLAQSFR